MNANKHLDFYNPDSIYYGNSRHYIQQLENKVRQQQAEIEALRKSHIELEKGIVKDLNQRQSAEPVAWMLADKEAEHIRSIMAVQHDFVPEGCVEIPLYTHPVKEHFEDEPQAEELHEIMQSNVELTDEEIIESLAELEHEQWMKWADTIMQTEKISDVRFARWASCMIPYAELTEEMKEFDREWARKALAILRKASEK